MTTRFAHKSLLAVAICVGFINLSATSAFARSGTTVTLPPQHITPPQGPPTTGVACNQAGTCAINGSGSGGTTHSPKGPGHRPQVTTSYPARF